MLCSTKMIGLDRMKMQLVFVALFSVFICTGLVLYEFAHQPVAPLQQTTAPIVLLSPDIELQGLQIMINQATPVELEQLPGIGPKKAQQIYDFIRQRGGISDIEELLEIEGIGEKTLARIKPFIIVA